MKVLFCLKHDYFLLLYRFLEAGSRGTLFCDSVNVLTFIIIGIQLFHQLLIALIDSLLYLFNLYLNICLTDWECFALLTPTSFKSTQIRDACDN